MYSNVEKMVENVENVRGNVCISNDIIFWRKKNLLDITVCTHIINSWKFNGRNLPRSTSMCPCPCPCPKGTRTRTVTHGRGHGQMDRDRDRDTWTWTWTWADRHCILFFDILSHSTFWHSTFCPIRHFSIRHFVSFDVISVRQFVPFDVLSHSTFCRSTFCPFGVCDFDILSVNRLRRGGRGIFINITPWNETNKEKRGFNWEICIVGQGE